MKQHEAVIEVMKKHGGFSTLGALYAEATKEPGVQWGTKTPFASIRRIVQDKRFFFKIRPGLWALNECKDRVAVEKAAGTRKETEITHAYVQGLLVELGNLKKFDTFVPDQDKNRRFLDEPLSNKISVSSFYNFGYDRFVQRARTIDVTWFNDRKMPASFFEVEHTTDMHGALVKFTELQDFNCRFVIVADKVREREFTSKISNEAFSTVKERLQFLDYEKLSKIHAHTHEIALLGELGGQS